MLGLLLVDNLMYVYTYVYTYACIYVCIYVSVCMVGLSLVDDLMKCVCVRARAMDGKAQKTRRKEKKRATWSV